MIDVINFLQVALSAYPIQALGICFLIGLGLCIALNHLQSHYHWRRR